MRADFVNVAFFSKVRSALILASACIYAHGRHVAT